MGDDLNALIAKLESVATGDAFLNTEIARAIFGHDLKWGQYTRSIDAALTLVPGFSYAISDLSDEGPASALLTDGNGRHYRANAATAPIAICLAALKARSAQKSDKRE